MSDILSRIIAQKRQAAAALSQPSPADIAAAPPPMDFSAALKNAQQNGKFPVVAEIKRKSPSAGILRNDDFQPDNIARQYQKAGAACLSVLTDAQFFGGENRHLNQARSAAKLPALRKDFIADSKQIAESRILGADAILLILAALPDDKQLMQFAQLAGEMHMTVIAEVHDENDLNRALKIPDALIGVNNRNLRNFHVALETTFRLAPKAKDAGRFVISESGIDSAESVQKLREHGADAFLVGSAFMRSPNPGDALRALFES